MVMRANIIIILVGILMIACKPSLNPPIEETNPLLGEWCNINDSNYIVSISDSLIRVNIISKYVCQYTKDSNVLYIKRLWFPETHPSYIAECNYSLKGDTLQIDEFEMSFAATYPPQFNSITLIRLKQ